MFSLTTLQVIEAIMRRNTSLSAREREAQLDGAAMLVGQIVGGSYARQSVSYQFGLLSQHEINVRVAKADGVLIPDTRLFRYNDDDTSGTTHSRDGFDTLLRLIESGNAPFTVLYVKDHTRLGRWKDPRDRHALEKHLEQHGVRVRYSEDAKPMNYATAQPDEVFTYYIKSALDSVVATEERTRFIRRTKSGARNRLARGLYPGSRIAFGLSRQLVDAVSLQPVMPGPDGVRQNGTGYRLTVAADGTDEVVRRIFEWAESGTSMCAIARRLNDIGARSPRARNGGDPDVPWSGSAVRNILDNPIYTGTLIWGDVGDGTPKPTPIAEADLLSHDGPLVVGSMLSVPLISPDQWQRVQRLLDGTREQCHGRRAGRPTFLLSSLLRCHHCKAPLSGHTASRRESQGVRRYYKHSRTLPAYRACPTQRTYVRTPEVEALVVTQIESWLASDDLLQIVRDEVRYLIATHDMADENQRRRELEERLAHAESSAVRAVRMRTAAQDDSLQAMYGKAAEDHASTARDCRAALTALGERSAHLARCERKLQETEHDWLRPLHSWREADSEMRKNLLAALLSSIEVDLDGGTCTLAVHVE